MLRKYRHMMLIQKFDELEILEYLEELFLVSSVIVLVISICNRASTTMEVRLKSRSTICGRNCQENYMRIPLSTEPEIKVCKT